METLVLVLHVLAALAIIGLVLLQHGKGADMGAAFGGGASGSLFGSTGSANFLSRTTALLATIFFVTSLALTWFSAHRTEAKGVMGTQPASQAPATAPSTTAPSTTAPSTTAPVPEPDKPASDADSKAKDIPK
jgi:preprotein translocase subunit SecG